MIIFVCSPFRAETEAEREANIRYARKKCREIAQRGDIPYASHLFAPQFLEDSSERERMLGISIGIEMMKKSDEVWVFGNRISEGMKLEIEKAEEFGKPVKFFRE